MTANPRCNAHKQRPVAPRGCQTCNRIAMEQEIVTRVVDALLAAGCSLATDYDQIPTRDRAVILSSLMETDDDRLIVRPAGWVYFVYGNDGFDVVSDYTTNLEAILCPTFNFIKETMEP
jgi:hypothetical protein